MVEKVLFFSIIWYNYNRENYMTRYDSLLQPVIWSKFFKEFIMLSVKEIAVLSSTAVVSLAIGFVSKGQWDKVKIRKAAKASSDKTASE